MSLSLEDISRRLRQLIDECDDLVSEDSESDADNNIRLFDIYEANTKNRFMVSIMEPDLESEEVTDDAT